MSESFRQRLSNYGRGKDNHHNEDVKSDAQGHKLNTYEDGEYGKLIVNTNLFTNKCVLNLDMRWCNDLIISTFIILVESVVSPVTKTTALSGKNCVSTIHLKSKTIIDSNDDDDEASIPLQIDVV